MLRHGWMVALGLMVACGGEPQNKPVVEPPTKEEPAPPPAPEPLGDVDVAEIDAEADKRNALVPSPIETQTVLEKVGIDTQLSSLVPSHTFRFGELGTSRVSIRTGVILADMLLTVKTSSDEELTDRLTKVREGMEQLRSGQDILDTIDDLKERVAGGAVNRDELLKELDELSNVVVPEIEFNGVAVIVPMIQAGSWLEGANLVARAVKAKGNPAAASDILKQADIVAYFEKYTAENTEEQSAKVNEVLTKSLGELAAVAKKDGELGEADVDTVIASTQAVLDIL